MSETIDLRSDTLTLPPPAMRRAMYEAELGDDVYGEDPTINRLERRAAELTGKEAGVFVASGTQGNLAAILTHCTRGEELIAGDQSHILHYEVGGAAAVAGVMVRTVRNEPDGTLEPDAIRAVVRNRQDLHHPFTTLICLENTQNRCGGTVLSPAYTATIGRLAREIGAGLHLDGARLFNAAVALDLPPADLCRDADSVTFCASKGLAAPVGSVLCGPAPFIQRARRWRKMLGGGMRQGGVIAAGALWALDNMVERLAEDHRLARRLAEGLSTLPGVRLDPAGVQTNIVVFALEAGRSPAGPVRGAGAARRAGRTLRRQPGADGHPLRDRGGADRARAGRHPRRAGGLIAGGRGPGRRHLRPRPVDDRRRSPPYRANTARSPEALGRIARAPPAARRAAARRCCRRCGRASATRPGWRPAPRSRRRSAGGTGWPWPASRAGRGSPDCSRRTHPAPRPSCARAAGCRAASATWRCNRMSGPSKSWPASTARAIPRAASMMIATSSALAWTAARPATPGSISRRASSSAASVLSASMLSESNRPGGSLGASATKIPRPCSMRSRRSLLRMRNASRTEDSPTPSSRLSSAPVGRRCPGSQVPCAMRARIASTTRW